MKIIFLLFIVSIFASCSRENISTPRVERVSLQWCFYDEATLKSGCDRKGEVLYSLSKKDQEILQSWIRDFVRTAHVDYVTYVPVLVIKGEEFFINILQNKIILNIKTKDGDRWTQISRDRKEVDEEIVNLVMKIIMKVDSPATGVAVGCERICTKKKGKAPYGLVTSTGNAVQPLQWSCEFTDTDLGLVYYNYRHYNPLDGRWTGRDPVGEKGGADLYAYGLNSVMLAYDMHGLVPCNKDSSGKIVAIKSFTFTLAHAAKDNDFNIVISEPASTITNYIMDAVNGEIEEAVPSIVSKLSSTIGSSLKSVLSAFNALNSVKRRAILATSIGTLYNEANLEIVASRCCCRKRNNKTVYIKKTVKGSGHNDEIMIDLRGLLLSSVTNKNYLMISYPRWEMLLKTFSLKPLLI